MLLARWCSRGHGWVVVVVVAAPRYRGGQDAGVGKGRLDMGKGGGVGLCFSLGVGADRGCWNSRKTVVGVI